MGISVLVSLYPLGQASLSPAINEALEVFRECGLLVEPGVMSSLLVGEDRAVFGALQEAYRRAAEHGPVVMVATFSNACPLPSESEGAEMATYRPLVTWKTILMGRPHPAF